MTTIAELLLARKADERPGLLDTNHRLTWGEVVERAAIRAGWLRSMRQDGPPHLGILLPNGNDYLIWLFAAALARWTVVGINPTRRGASLALDIQSTDCQLLICDDEGFEMLDGLDHGVEASRVFDEQGSNDAALAHGVAEWGGDAVESDLLLLLFTSGTTGTPKAVRCTQGRLTSIALTASAGYGYVQDDVCYCPMPLFHGNALMALVAPALYVGAAIALPPRFSASGFIDDVRHFQATIFTYVGKAISYILATPSSDHDLDNTLTRGFGTEASSTDRVAFKRRFGCRLIEGYGSSEGGMSISATPDTPRGALGPALPGLDIAVVDPDSGEEKKRAVFDEGGALLNGNDAIGELVNRSGVGKFEGYYKNDQAGNSRSRDGWYWSGDLAYRDAEGFFFFAGRSGDWLRVDSENMAATPIENVLARYGPFANVAIYPVPDFDAGAGDLVMAAVELRDSSEFDPDSFQTWILDQDDFGTKWTPSFLRVMEKIDETATGKMTKVRLRNEAWQCDDVVWYRPARENSFHLLDIETSSKLNERLERARSEPKT